MSTAALQWKRDLLLVAGEVARRRRAADWLLYAEWGVTREQMQGGAGRLVTQHAAGGALFERLDGAMEINPSEWAELAPPPAPDPGEAPAAPLPLDSRLRQVAKLVAIVRAGRPPVLEHRRWWELHLRGGAIRLGADAASLRTALRAGGNAPGAVPWERAGAARLILAPAAAGVLLHELVGHLLESDHPLAASVREGSALLPLPLTVRDDPRELTGAPAVDDEGEATAPRDLLRRGRVAGWLASRRHARAGTAAGNGRRRDWLVPALPRASALVAEGGETAREKLLASPGALLVERASGHLEGERVTLRIEQAAQMRRGEPGEPVAPFALRWKRGDLARALTRASRETGDGGGALCVKAGQPLPIALRAPWLEMTL